MGRPPGLGRSASETLGLSHGFPEITKAAVAERRLDGFGNIRTSPLGCFRFNLADRLLQRQSLSRDIGLVQRRLDAPQLANERGARAIVKRAAIFARAPIEATHRTGN
jgi:hypothetical protein